MEGQRDEMPCQDYRLRARKRQDWLVTRSFWYQGPYWTTGLGPSGFTPPLFLFLGGTCCSSQAGLLLLPLSKPVSPPLQRPSRISLDAFPDYLPHESCPHRIVPDHSLSHQSCQWAVRTSTLSTVYSPIHRMCSVHTCSSFGISLTIIEHLLGTRHGARCKDTVENETKSLTSWT